MIERILPASVAAVDTTTDPPEAVLFPEEEVYVARAVDKRRREFTTARHCARQAMGALGVAPTAILRSERGEPQWPEGLTGSMTHTAGYRAAAVARVDEFRSLGIDAEENAPLPDGVLGSVSLPSERAWISRQLQADPSIAWDRLLFCAKECVFKAWFPLARSWLGFEDAEIEVDAVDRTFQARLLVPGPDVDGRQLDGFVGRWQAFDELIVATIVQR